MHIQQRSTTAVAKKLLRAAAAARARALRVPGRPTRGAWLALALALLGLHAAPALGQTLYVSNTDYGSSATSSLTLNSQWWRAQHFSTAVSSTGHAFGGGEGAAAGHHRDHCLHRAQDPRWLAIVGFDRGRPSLRPQAEGLTAPFPDVLPARRWQGVLPSISGSAGRRPSWLVATSQRSAGAISNASTSVPRNAARRDFA